MNNRVGSHRAARSGDASRRSPISLVGAGARARAHPEGVPAEAMEAMIACPSCDQPAPYVSSSGESGKTVHCPVCGPGRVIDIDSWDDDTAFLPAAVPLPDETPASAVPAEGATGVPWFSTPAILAGGGVAAVVLGIVLVRALSGPANVAEPVASTPGNVEVTAAPSEPEAVAPAPEVASSAAGVSVVPPPAAPPAGDVAPPSSELAPAPGAPSAAIEAKPAPAAESKAALLYAPIAEPAKVEPAQVEPAKKVEPVAVEKAPIVEAKRVVEPPAPVVAAAPAPAAPAVAAAPVAQEPAPVVVAAVAPPPPVAAPAPAASAASPVLGDTDLPNGAIAPKPLDGNPAPRYPKLAHRSGKGGEVVLRILITAEGLIGDVQVLEGKEPFIGAAVKAVKRWRYEPAQHQGKAIPVHRTIRLGFALAS